MNSIFSRILATLERILASSTSAKDIAEIKASIVEIKTDVALIKEAIFTVPPPDDTDEQARIDALTARIKTQNDFLAAFVAANRPTP